MDKHSAAPHCTRMWDKAVIALSGPPKLNGTVLLSALYVLFPFHVWVNPAFYQWHRSAFTKRISELECTGQETGFAKRAAHFLQ